MSETISHNNNCTLEEYGPLLSVPDIAALLGISTRTVYRLAESGGLSCVKIGRKWFFPKQHLSALFDSCGPAIR